MKKHSLLAAALLTALGLGAKPQIQRVEPLNWWTDMQCPLTLMLQGQDLADAAVSVQRLKNGKPVKGECDGLVPTGQHNAESLNYLFVDMAVQQPGTYRITLTKNKKKTSVDYEILARDAASASRVGFNSSDCIYLIMSDRFVDGDESNNSTADTREPANKDNINGRFGGDIAGVISQLDRIKALGATTIWCTPMLLDDEAAWSYHGYACGDYYHIDPRMGSNLLYKQMVDEAHARGMKVVMDMVPNHCGAAHWWMQDLPYQDWINQFPTFTHTNGAFSTNFDPNASEFDKALNDAGWFDTPMPDMNLRNPDLLHYFKQWAIWWIEYAGLDGLRVDTYPYINAKAGSEWCKAIMTEYPHLNIVGECWTRPTSAVAYWQAGAGNKDGFDSHMPSVMDFPLEEAIRQALEGHGRGWGGGLTKCYDVLSQDYLYGDVNNLLLFLSNHDMARFSDVVLDKDPRRAKLGMTLLATMRGIPQLFYGEEYNLHVEKEGEEGNHSYLRMPLPLGELTEEQAEMNAYVSRLLNWRLNEPVIHTGRTMHFYSNNNTYVFVRYNDTEAVFVAVNGAEEERALPMYQYEEILSLYAPAGVDILTNRSIRLDAPVTLAPLSSLVVKLTK